MNGLTPLRKSTMLSEVTILPRFRFVLCVLLIFLCLVFACRSFSGWPTEDGLLEVPLHDAGTLESCRFHFLLVFELGIYLTCFALDSNLRFLRFLGSPHGS